MSDEPLTGRCMKCKGPKEMKDVEIETKANGARMARGKCVDCGTTVCKFLPKEQKDAE